MFQKIKLVTIAFFVGTLCSAQDLQKDFATIGEKMESASSISIAVDVKMYSSKGGSLGYSSKASSMKMGEYSKSVLGELEFINTPKFELKLDHEERAILIYKRDTTSTSFRELSLEDFDVKKLQKFFEKNQSQPTTEVKLVSAASGVKTYSITGAKGIKEMRVVLNMTSKKISKITYEYDGSGQYVVLTYSGFDYDKDLSSHFNLDSYFKEVGGKYVLTDKLKNYHLYTEK